MQLLKQLLCTPVCVCCGSFFCGPALYCNVCYDRLIVAKLCAQSGNRSHCGDKHQYLFEWANADAEEFSQLIYRLKSDSSVFALQHYGKLLLSKLQEQPELKGFAGVVPIPSTRSGSVHAHLLAKQLAKELRIPYIDSLVKEGETDQKTLSASERSLPSNSAFRLRTDEVFTTGAHTVAKYILVDDVLTTGQSFKQASAALGGHPGNLIATLFYRVKTATPVS